MYHYRLSTAPFLTPYPCGHGLDYIKDSMKSPVQFSL